MRKLACFFGAALLLSMIGCASPAEDGADGTTGDDQNLTQINGQDPATYYKQFVYRREQRTSGSGYWHYYPSTVGYLKLPNGQFTSLRIYPRADGSYTAEYAELTQRSPSEYVHEYDNKNLSGRWRVEGTKIIFDGLGTGEGMMVNDEPGFRLTYSRNIHTPGLSGDSTNVKIVASSWGPDGNQ